jgi:uncharacterized hydrophobic protein (TIGR00271 family)
VAEAPNPKDASSSAEPERSAIRAASRDLRALFIRTIRRLRGPQDRLLRLLGASRHGREDLVAGMLERNPNEATTYWLQLVVSVGIATLGLVLGSVAIIIGAMLVAPLMTPILALAMGLAAGSPFLVLRSSARILASVGVAIGGAALMTVLLPFHELNAEIASRTSPTALDLLTAAFCALAGVYASLRPGSDTATTAAGTSIGISLVPPLCASGYGFGIGAWSVAGGAALLFLTNLVAIIVVGTISFVAAGFNRVNVTRMERAELARNAKHVITAAIARRLAGLFESRAGPALRFLMPLLLLAAVYVPLRRALDEVAWQVRVRSTVQDLLANERHKIVQSRIRAERHEVNVRLVLLGSEQDGEASRSRLEREIRAATDVEPIVDVIAIPDATAIAGLESSLRLARDPIPVAPGERKLSPSEELDAARSRVRSHVARLWPAATSGKPLVVEVGTADKGPLRVRVVHLGRSLSPDAKESITRSLAAALEREVALVDAAIPVDTLGRDGNDLKFVAQVSAGVRASATIDGVSVCVTEAPVSDTKRPARDTRDRELADALGAVFASYPRVSSAPGDAWRVRFVLGNCPAETKDGGAPDAAP